jgi:hypothetical protein
MASEIDFDSTVVGGSSELAQAPHEAAELDAWPVDPGDLLSADADEINHVRHGSRGRNRSAPHPSVPHADAAVKA